MPTTGRKLTMLWLTLAAAGVHAAPLTIRNETLEVAYDPATETLSATAPGAPARLVGGKLRASGGTARVAAASDPVFGAGQALEVARPDGSLDRVLLYPRLPFVLFRSVLRNPGAEATVTNQVKLLSVGVDLGTAAESVKAWGTGGLTAPDKHAGSYVYLALADPATRRGAVGAWLTHDRGSGVVFSGLADGRPELSARVDYGRLRLAPGATAETEAFALGLFADARDGLEGWADAVARHYRIQLPPQPAGYCTWYSDGHGGAGDEKSLVELAEFCARELKPFGFEVVQIDDGWQLGDAKGNGPRKWFLGVRPNGPYAAGMKATADRIRATGLTAGIWFMPFAGTHNDPLFADHQDWFVKRPDGKPYDTAWGGTSLDMTVPGAREHLRAVVAACREWGYRYFKMDGLYTGLGCNQVYINDGYKDDKFGDAVFANPDKTNVEAYRDGLKLVREAGGRDVFLLGCCISQNMRSFGASIGLVDAMRIGPDNGTQWSNALVSPGTGRGLLSGPAAGTRRYFLQGRVWYNDPDPIYVRASMAWNHLVMIASWAGVTGQLTIDSDWLPSVPPERLDVFKRVMPAHGLHARPVDLFDHDLPRLWLLSDTREQPRRDVLAIFNWEAQEVTYDQPFERLGLAPASAYVAYDFWGRQLLPLQKGKLSVSVPAQSCRVLALRALADRPQVISTSRHVSQGMVELRDERWDAATSTLSGSSQLVANDPYELRVLLLGDGRAWAVDAASVAAADQAAGVTVSVAEGHGLGAVSLRSATSRRVRWSVKVKPADPRALKPAAPTDLKAAADPFRKVELTWQGAPGLSYEVARDGAPAVLAGGTRYHDAGAVPGKSHTYTVVAVDLLGTRSAPVTLKVDVPPVPKIGPVPPKPHVSLTSLKPTQARNGYGALQTNKSNAGHPLTIGKEIFADGLGVHAPSRLVYNRAPEWARFVAVVGLDNEERAQEAGSIAFRVLSDSGQGEPTVLAESPVLTYETGDRWHFDVALPADCKRVVLECGDAGDGIRCDHGDWCLAGFLLKAPTAAEPGFDLAPKLAEYKPSTSSFFGNRSLDFRFQGRNAKIVTPPVTAVGRPWAWRLEFFGHEPQTDRALLAAGFHVVYCDTLGMMGGPPAMAIYDKFYDLLQELGLSKKGALIGMSRGGLYAYNWAARRPETVSCIYADNPVLDVKSWPGKKGASKSQGSAGDWAAVMKHYGFKDEAEALAYKLNPVDNLEPLAKAGIPILHVVGDADRVVPVAENSNLVEERYPKLGGKIKVIHKPGLDHHPHSLPDPTPIVEFVLAATG